MAWPCRPEPWGSLEGLLRARVAYAAVARALSGFERVTMVVRPEDHDEARLACGKGIDFAGFRIDDSWMRDIGPLFVTDGAGGVAGVHWRFNAWGNKYHPHDGDAALAESLLDALDMRAYAGPMVLEGGSIVVDGLGTLITTEQCLLNPNRNPNLTRQQIEERLAIYLGITKVIWLGEGLADDETDGHVDNIVSFAGPGRVLVHRPRPDGSTNDRVMRDNLLRLAAAHDARGQKLEIIEVPEPSARLRHDGRRLEMSYINSCLANHGLVVPAFGDPCDDEVVRLMEKVFPDRRVVQVPALDIVEGGGGLHCITMQQPAGEALAQGRF